MALALMPSLLWKKATLRARPTRPCLEVVYPGPPVPPRKLLSEAVLLMTPLWRAIMWGNTAQVSRNGPVRLIAMVLFDAILPPVSLDAA